jgi:anti-sigma-K factor RskA
MRDELRDLAAGAALGSIPSEERASFDAEAGRDPALAAEAARYRAVVSTLEDALKREAPPTRLFDGVLARVEAEGAPDEVVAAEPPQRAPAGAKQRRPWSWRPRSFVPVFAAGFATAAAVAAVAFVLTGSDDLGPTTAVADVRGAPEYAAVHGTATLHASDEQDGHLVLELGDVPAPPPGEHYEVWVLRAEGEGEMEAVGVFVPTGEDVKLDLGLPGPGDYRAVDVSVEPDGGSPEHSGASLAGGKFGSADA